MERTIRTSPKKVKGTAKKAPDSYSLKDTPTESFRMRLSTAHAAVVMPILLADAKENSRSLPRHIEYIIRKHYKLVK